MNRAEQERRWTTAKAKRAGAKLCLDQGFYSESVTLSYYACYQAMWAAVGSPPAGLWRQGGLINEFCRGRWQRPPAVPQTLATLRKRLDRLYVYRIRSDYEAQRLTKREAQQGLDIADQVFRLVAEQAGLGLS